MSLCFIRNLCLLSILYILVLKEETKGINYGTNYNRGDTATINKANRFTRKYKKFIKKETNNINETIEIMQKDTNQIKEQMKKFEVLIEAALRRAGRLY